MDPHKCTTQQMVGLHDFNVGKYIPCMGPPPHFQYPYYLPMHPLDLNTPYTLTPLDAYFSGAIFGKYTHLFM